MNDQDRQFADAARVIEDSVALKSVEAVRSALGAAIANSRGASRLQRVAAGAGLTPLADRVRQIGIVVATACLTHIVLVQWMPAPLAPAVPVAWWIAFALAAIGVAFAAGPLTSAWRHRRG